MGVIPRFETERLIIREVGIEDIESYTKHFVDYEVIRNLSYKIPWPYPNDGVQDWIANEVIPNQGKGRWNWSILLKENPTEVIGCIDLMKDNPSENRGFWLGKAHWGKGIMTEAVYPTIDFAFGKGGFDKLCFANALGNEASRRIKEKTGCTFIGLKPGKFVDPALTEREMWELTKDNWEKHKLTYKLDYEEF